MINYNNYWLIFYQLGYYLKKNFSYYGDGFIIYLCSTQVPLPTAKDKHYHLLTPM